MENPELKRSPTYPINPLFLRRWSPRAMTGEKIEKEKLMSLFEAARWAPSSYNAQPWRFIYGIRETKAFEKLFQLLVEFNQKWCEKAAALVLIVSRTTTETSKKPAKTFSFSTGSAFQNLCLQGSFMNLVVHGMEGFNYDKAKEVFQIPEDFKVEAMCAIGIPASKEVLPPEIQEKEKPSLRRPLEEIVAEGNFTFLA